MIREQSDAGIKKFFAGLKLQGVINDFLVNPQRKRTALKEIH